jgi:cytochrome c oxidase subunit 1
MSNTLEFDPPQIKAATIRVGRPDNYLTHEHSIGSWLATHDHKRLAILYTVSLTLFFFIGSIPAALIRIQLLTPEGAIVAPDVYNRLFTWHGVVMVWFFLVPSIPVTLGNFCLPLMLGTRDVAFPKINLLSWYIFVTGGLLTLVSLYWGGVDTGWTFYTPYSSEYATGHVVLAACGILVVGFSSIATGVNFIVSIHKLRAPGMTFHRMPIFLWSLYATSVIYVLATPVLAMTLILLAFETFFKVGIFNPALGGDPLLFQHLFYSHPAVYIMILPGMGVISEVIPAFSRKRLFGYSFVAWSAISIAVIGFFVWAHHMFVAGTSVFSATVFSLLSFWVAVPSAIKVFNWVGTLHKGFIHFDAPMIYALGFIVLFTIGGLTGLWLATLSADVHLHDTYFVIAHFHYIMVGGMVSAYFAGIHYWWPKITGRMYPEAWGRIAAGIIFAGFTLTFAPQFLLGYYGMPRRYATYAPEFQVLNIFSSAGAGVLAVGYVLPLIYLTWSLFRGEHAPDNPWGATGLEWKTRSPPPPENFTTTPVVTGPPYDYPAPEAIELSLR